MQSDIKYLLLLAGWQGGKTTVGAYKLLSKIDERIDKWYDLGCPENRRPTFMITAPRQEDLINITLPKFMEVCPENSYTYDISHNVIHFNNGAVVLGRSAYKPSSIESATLDWIWADEAGLYKREAWTKLRPRIKIRRGGIIFTTTPHAMTWLYDEVYLRWLEGDPDYEVISWRSIDNPNFPQEEYYKEMNLLTQEEFDMKYNGKFTRLSGMIYPFAKSKHVLKIDNIPNKFDIVIGGIDFGTAKPCGISVIGINNGVYYLLDEFKRKGVELEDLSDKLWEFKDSYKVSYWYADPEDPKAIDYLRQQGLMIRKANNEVSDGLRAVRTLFHQDRVFFSEKCTEHIKEIQSYAYQMDDDGYYREAPIKRNDHVMDSLRYPIYTHHYSELDKINEVLINWDRDENRVINLDRNRIMKDFRTPSIRETMSPPMINFNPYDNEWFT